MLRLLNPCRCTQACSDLDQIHVPHLLYLHLLLAPQMLIYLSLFIKVGLTKLSICNNTLNEDMGHLKYFLGIEIVHNKSGVSLCEWKYATDLLKDTRLLGMKPVDTPIDINSSVWDDTGEFFEDKAKYRRLVGKLIYLTITRLDIFFAIGIVSHFMDKLRILKYIKKEKSCHLREMDN
ncbi:hypothetical protein ZIOFF_058318 [Zingiber officinale]|uniref:Mitochondrial protein n=1 Tax=Zingiber officinale TaxID=94328 RepID=A0A8J5KHR2_ZINOF|nr:hypothetical protein ZIOFF_058318 [Zingiber officinale]